MNLKDFYFNNKRLENENKDIDRELKEKLEKDDLTRKKIITEISKPVFVIAGPGTGKTELIVRKIDHLIENENLSEEKILAITFTEKAAEEMSNRIQERFNKDVIVKTFHSFALELLEEENIIPEGYKILEESLSILLLYDYIKNNKIKLEIFTGNLIEDIKGIYNLIIKFKEFGFNIDSLANSQFENKQEILKVFKIYEEIKRKKKLFDFPDLLLILLKELENNNKLLEEVKKKIEYILVDEFQDTNKVQVDILNLISTNNITIVGDQKQSIYKFRGANLDSFEYFKNLKKEISLYYLNRTFRFKTKIIDLINLFIDDDKEKLFSYNDKKNNKNLLKCNNKENFYEIYMCNNESSTVKLIEEIILKNYGKKIGVLCRSNRECKYIINRINNKIIIETNQVVKIKENYYINKILSILRILYDTENSQKEIFYLLEEIIKNKDELKNLIINLKDNYYENLKTINLNDFLRDKLTIKRLEQLKKRLEELKELFKYESLRNIIFEICNKFNIFLNLALKGNRTDLELINKFIDYAYIFEKDFGKNYYLFFEFVEILSEYDIEIDTNNNKIDNETSHKNKKGSIEILTLHKSKGKEYDIVIIPFLNEKRFPLTFRKDKFDTFFNEMREEFIEEEKNLFFVGITRCKEKVYLSYVEKYNNNKTIAQPSRFLNRINCEHKYYFQNIINYEYCMLNNKEKDEIEESIKKINLLLKDKKYDSAIIEIERLKKKNIEKEIEKNNKIIVEKLNQNTNEKVSKIQLSASKISLYLQCPKKYEFTYIYKIPTKDIYFFTFGKVLHKVLEILTKKYIYNINEKTNKIYDFNELYKIAVELLKTNWKTNGFENIEQVREYFNNSLIYISEYLKKELEWRDKRNLIAVEKFIKFNFNENTEIIGYIDRIDKTEDGYEIIDYKTSKSAKSKRDLRKDIQLFLYFNAMKNKLNINKVALWYLMKNKIIEIKPDELEKDEIVSQINEAITGIKNNNYEPKPSFSCKFCDFKNICKAYRNNNNL